jgi:hypothetical protein
MASLASDGHFDLVAVAMQPPALMFVGGHREVVRRLKAVVATKLESVAQRICRILWVCKLSRQAG